MPAVCSCHKASSSPHRSAGQGISVTAFTDRVAVGQDAPSDTMGAQAEKRRGESRPPVPKKLRQADKTDSVCLS